MLYDEYVIFDSEETEEYLKEQCKIHNVTHITFDENAIVTQRLVDEFIETILIMRGIKEKYTN